VIALRFHRAAAAGISFVFLATQVVFAQKPEKSFWDQRRQTARRVHEGTRGGGQETRLARWTPGAALELPPVDKFLAPDRLPVPAAPAEAGLPSGAVSSELSALAGLLSRHGVVRDIRPGPKAAPILIYIQDVHGRADAQRSAASLLLDLWERHPDAPLGLEGADGEIDLNPFRGPSVEADREAASFFFNAGFIAGPEFAALASPAKPGVFGLEDPALYLKNTAAVRAALPRRTAWLEKIAAWKKRADARKAAVFSPALLDLDDKTRARENDGLPLGDYLSYLSSRAGGGEKLPNVSLFLQTWDMEKTLDFAAVERERGRLLARLAEGLDRKSLAGLLAASASFRAGELGYADYHRLLKSAAERAGVVWTSFPAFDRYVQYVVRADALRAEAFFGEISRLEESAWRRLIATPQQAELHARFKNISLLEKLVRLSLTPDQWAEYVRRRQAVHAIAGPAAAELAPFEGFYEAAEARNGALAGRMISRLAAPSRTAAPRVAVLVAGGFHAAGLAPMLARHGTLITVSPKFETGPGGAENDYLSVFTRGKLPLEQLFESPKISLVGRPTVTTPSGRNMLARLMPPLRQVFAALQTERTAAVPVETGLIVEGAAPGSSLPEIRGSVLAEGASDGGRRYRIRRNAPSLPSRLYARIKLALGRNPAPAPESAADAIRQDSAQEETPGVRAKPSFFNVVVRRPVVEQIKRHGPAAVLVPALTLPALAALGAPMGAAVPLAAVFALKAVEAGLEDYARDEHPFYTAQQRARLIKPIRRFGVRTIAVLLIAFTFLGASQAGPQELLLQPGALDLEQAWRTAATAGAAGGLAGIGRHVLHNARRYPALLDIWSGRLPAGADVVLPAAGGGDPSPSARAEEVLAAIRRGPLATGRLRNSLRPLKDELEDVLGNLGLSAELAGQLSQQLIKKTGVNSPQDPRLQHLAQRLQREMTELRDLRIPKTPLFRGILKLTPAEIRSLKQRIEQSHPAIAETILYISLLSADPAAAATRFMARYDAALEVLLALEEQEVAKTIAHHSFARSDAEAGAAALLRTFQHLVEELSRRAPPSLAREAALNSFWAKNPFSKALGYLQADAEKPGRHVRILAPGHLAERAPLLEFPFAGPVQIRAGSREYTITAQDHGFTVTDEASGGARPFSYGATAGVEIYSDGDEFGTLVWNRVRFSASRADGTTRLKILSAQDLTGPVRISWTTPEPSPAAPTPKGAARPNQDRRGRLIEAVRDLAALAPRIGGGITALEFEGLAKTARPSLSLHMARRELRGLWLAGFFEGAEGEQGRKRVGNPFRYYLPPWFLEAAERLSPGEMENLINTHLFPAFQVSELPNNEEARSAAQAAVANFRRQARAALRAADEAERLLGLEYLNVPEAQLRDSLREIGFAAEKIDALAAWLSEHGEIDSADQAGDVLGISKEAYRSLIGTLENVDAWRALEFDMEDIAERLDGLERGEGLILDGIEAAIEELQASISRLEEIEREHERLAAELPRVFFTYDFEGIPAAGSLRELTAARRRSLADRARSLLVQHQENPEALFDSASRALMVTTSMLHDYVRAAFREIGEMEIAGPASGDDAPLSWLGVHEGLVLRAQVIPGDPIKIRLDLSEKAAESHEPYTLSATFAVVLVDARSGQVRLPNRWNRRDNRQISFEYHNVPPGTYRFDVIETSPAREQLGEGGHPKALHWTALTALAGLAAWSAGFAPGAFWAAGAGLEILVLAAGLWNPARFELLHELEYQSFSDLRRAEIHDWRIVARNKRGRITQINPDILRGLPQWLQRHYLFREKFFLQKLGKPGDALTYPLDPLFLAWMVLRAAAWDPPKALFRKAADAQRKKLSPWQATRNDPSRTLKTGETLHVENIGPANILISLADETWRLRPSSQAGRLVLENLVSPPALYLRRGNSLALRARNGEFAVRRRFITNVVSVTNLGPRQMTLRLEEPALPGTTGRRGTGSLIPWSPFYTGWLAPAAELVLAALIQAALPWDNVWLKALLTAAVVYAAHLVVHGIYFKDWKSGFTRTNAETSLGLGAAAGLFGGLGAGQAAPWLFAAAQAGRHFFLNRNFPFWRRHVVAGYALLEARSAAGGPRAEAFRALLENSGRVQTNLTDGLDPRPWRKALADKAAAQFHILANPQGGDRARRRAQVNLAVLAHWLGMDHAPALGLAETAREPGASVQGAQGLWTAYRQRISLNARELRRLGVRSKKASYNEGARAEKPHLAAVYLPALEEEAEVWNVTAEHARSLAAQPPPTGIDRHRALVIRADPGVQEADDAWKTAVKERWMERLLEAGRARDLSATELMGLEVVVVPTSGLLTRDGILAGALPALGVSPELKEAFGLSLFSATENGLDLTDLAAVLYRLLKGDKLVPILDVIDNQRVYATQA
jgi:hypothetical protein